MSGSQFLCVSDGPDGDILQFGDGDPDEQPIKSDLTYAKLLSILMQHAGEAGESEGAVDVLRRLIRERDEARSAKDGGQ